MNIRPLLFLLLSPALLPLTLIRADEGTSTQKRIIADFEDVGTWRMIHSHGTKPEAWFSGGAYLSGSTKETDHDQYVGEIKFAFDLSVSGPYSATFRRQKATLVSGSLNGIEFDADSKDLPVSIQFVVRDSSDAAFTTALTPLSGGWHPYRIELNEETVPQFKACKFPAHLDQIILSSIKPCSGSVFLDDIALTGAFTKQDQIAIFPVSNGLAYTPNAPVELRYRLRNARSEPFPVNTRLEVHDFRGKSIFSGECQNTLPSYGQALAKFSLPPLPIGAYAAAVTVDTGSFHVDYDDSFGVFIPNGRRLNQKSMWFGIGESSNWFGEGENALHLEWMRQLGVDMIRIQAAPYSIEPKPGVFSYESWRPLLDSLTKADIKVLFMCTNTPTWTQPAHPDWVGVPEDMEAFRRYSTDAGTFFKQFPIIKYVEFWNEPDTGVIPLPGVIPQSGFFHGSLEDYLKMFHVFSQSIRATDPDVKITNGGLCVLHPREKPGFSEGAIKQGAPDYDIAAFHAHGPLSNFVEREELLEKWMKEAGINKPICNTEAGERSGYDALGRVAQAITLVKKITYAKSLPNTEFYCWFLLKDYWDMDPKADDSFGLVTSDDRVKPSFIAYNTLIHELANTTPAEIPSLNDHVDAYAFRHDDGSTTYVCWPKAGSSGTLLWLKCTQTINCVDIFGASETLASYDGLTPINIGSEPIYLETPAGASALTVAGPGEGCIDIDNGVQNEAGNSSFSVKVQNPDSGVMQGELALEDNGQKVWTQSLSLGSAQKTAYEVPLAGITPGASDMAGHRYVLTLQLNPKPSFRFPLNLVLPYSLAYAPGNPINSDLNDFVQKLPALTLKRREDVFELAFDPAIPAWRGPEDLSVKARACHDNNGIYFRFDVTDDKHVPSPSLAQLWLGDSLQLAVASPDQKEYTILGLGLLNSGPAAWCSDSPKPALVGQWDVPLRIERKGTLTAYEVYLPFSKLGISYANGLQPIRFSFLVNENDGQGRVRWIHWHDGIGKGEDIDLLGYGTLMGR